MLTIEEYKKKYPNAKCWGAFAEMEEHILPYCVIKEGLLQFTEESAHNWAGPFEGGYAQFVLKDYTNSIQKSGPNKGKKYLDVLAAAEKERKAKAERSIFPEKQKFHKYLEDPSWEFPIKLWIMGNDDTSYSKCYRNEKEALDELNLFSANEPLDFYEVIDDFRFIFTN